jgi:LuxR family maltose regulon positive regulatory protein
MIPGLLATKLYRPSLPPKRVRRPHLSQRLDEGLKAGRRITLVSAPAGFGKTTCITEWVEALDLPVTWLSLDSTDDDPGRFFAYLVAALQRVDEELGHEITGILSAGEVPPAEIISTTLINDILEHEERFLLILDDLQVVQDPFILQVLERLVANQPPPMHLVLLSREDPSLPLALLRANNQLTEIRAGDLRFARQDAARFLNEVMGLSLSQADINLLETKTEGWIAGLQLAALALQAPLSRKGRTDPSAFIATLSGSHRFILSYLAEQVLDQQPAEIQRFLLQTSILDRLSGDLCDAVTGHSDSRSLLEQLYSDNLFLMPLDDEQQWYRYHQLFVDLLRDRLDTLYPNQTAELHRRAAHWYVQASEEDGTFVRKAIEHALAAPDYALAVDLLERHAMDMLMQWHIKTVDAWMQAIPQEWTLDNPRVNLAFAWALMLRGLFDQAAPYLGRLQAMFSAPGPEGGAAPQLQVEDMDDSVRVDWLALQAMLLSAQGKARESLAVAHQALEIAHDREGYTFSQVYMGLATAYEQLEDYDRAHNGYQMIIRLGRESGILVTEMLGLSGLALMALNYGQLHFAFDLASQGVERLERLGSLPPLAAALYGELAVCYYHWHQLDEAHSHFLRAIQVSALSGYSDAEVFYGVILSRLYHMAGDLDAATREIQKTMELVRVDVPARVREEAIAQHVRILLAQHQLAAAEAALKGEGFSDRGAFIIPDPRPDQEISRTAAVLYSSGLRILLYRAQVKDERSSLRRGIELADHLLGRLLNRQYIPAALDILLLRAKMHAVLGNDPVSRAASQADYVLALELAEPEGFISIFVEGGPPVAGALADMLECEQIGAVQPGFVKSVLAAFAMRRPPAGGGDEQTAPAPVAREPTPLITPLTERELDVLRLMAQGLKYAEIADHLYISLNTVRFHVKAIYGKLYVNNRTQALDRARQLQLL